MSSPVVDAQDFATYLGDPNIDQGRAELILANAQALCESIVAPLPANAGVVVLDVAARMWSNPVNAQQETTGPFSVAYGTVSGGAWLTRANIATLRRLSGKGGAFTIDVMPATAGQGLPWWDLGVTGGDDMGDWDVPA